LRYFKYFATEKLNWENQHPWFYESQVFNNRH
jgi:hypothetical protein